VGCCSTRAQVLQAAPVVFPVDFDGGEHVYRVHPINVQLVTDPVIMPAKEEHGCDSSETLITSFNMTINARCHVARVCQDFLNQNHIRVLPWPALSPDLSPIEHLLSCSMEVCGVQ
jgi:hypothetical protein